jgi:outer membrane protein TolC
VLDAERQLDGAENGLARSEAALDEALIGLYKALGGGWENQETADEREVERRPIIGGLSH